MNHNKTDPVRDIQTNHDAKDDRPSRSTKQQSDLGVMANSGTDHPDVKDEPASQDPAGNAQAQWLQVRARHPALGMCRR